MLINLTLNEGLRYSAYILGFLWLFWGFYVQVMGLYRVYLRKELKGLNAVLALPYVIVGLLLDVFANVFLGTFVFLELPKEFLVTSRLQRYKTYKRGYKLRMATLICEGMLDVFDPTGDHC